VRKASSFENAREPVRASARSAPVSQVLKRAPSLTDQARQTIRQRILAGEFADDRIPSESDLANELGVSRTTIRDALSRLEAEGVIYRKQGAGTFVNRPGLRIRSRLEEVWSYESILRAHGYTPSTRIISRRETPAGPELSQTLDLSPEEPVLVVEKLFLEDELPVILARNTIPMRLITRPFKEAALLKPVFDFLLEYGGQPLGYYISELVPELVDGRLAQTLGLKSGTPLISFEEVGYNEANEPILTSKSYFRDDLLRLRLIRRKV
jgi:GntR family transcriptional regulator